MYASMKNRLRNDLSPEKAPMRDSEKLRPPEAMGVNAKRGYLDWCEMKAETTVEAGVHDEYHH